MSAEIIQRRDGNFIVETYPSLGNNLRRRRLVNLFGGETLNFPRSVMLGDHNETFTQLLTDKNLIELRVWRPQEDEILLSPHTTLASIDFKPSGAMKMRISPPFPKVDMDHSRESVHAGVEREMALWFGGNRVMKQVVAQALEIDRREPSDDAEPKVELWTKVMAANLFPDDEVAQANARRFFTETGITSKVAKSLSDSFGFDEDFILQIPEMQYMLLGNLLTTADVRRIANINVQVDIRRDGAIIAKVVDSQEQEVPTAWIQVSQSEVAVMIHLTDSGTSSYGFILDTSQKDKITIRYLQNGNPTDEIIFRRVPKSQFKSTSDMISGKETAFSSLDGFVIYQRP